MPSRSRWCSNLASRRATSRSFPSFVAELDRSSVALIVTHAVATTIVVKAPRTVPVVYEFSADPLSAGMATDLRHPLFNAHRRDAHAG